jgi:hypothetical protein
MFIHKKKTGMFFFFIESKKKIKKNKNNNNKCQIKAAKSMVKKNGMIICFEVTLSRLSTGQTKNLSIYENQVCHFQTLAYDKKTLIMFFINLYFILFALFSKSQ